MKLANSSYYGLPRAVGTIREAVALLGNRTVRNLAILAATQDVLGQAVLGYELGEGDLWRHSLACAMASQMLAEKVRYPDPEEAFVAGLLHDVGKVILGLYVQEAIEPIRERMEADNSTFMEAEHAVLGFDHATIGGRILMHWNMPLPLAQAVAWHHDPAQGGQPAPLAAIVHIANIICLTAGIGLGADGLRAAFCSQALQTLHIDEAQAGRVLEQLVSRIADIQPFFAGAQIL